MPLEVIRVFESGDFKSHMLRAAKLMNSGGVVVLPTETVYGAAALLSDPAAASRLRKFRGDERMSFTIHIASTADAAQYLGDVSELGHRMMRKLWPGPVALTFVVPEKRRAEIIRSMNVAESDLFTGDAITLRCPDHIVAQSVLSQVKGPVGMTLVETRPDGDDRFDPLAGSVDLVLDAGPPRFAKPSTIVRVFDNDFKIERTGIYDHRIIERMLRTTVLFVCSGNTCRSPMAEALARQIMSTRLNLPPDALENQGYSVLSAGAMAMPGARATSHAVEAVQAFGADLSRHRSRALSVELIHQADAIITMGRSHRNAVMALVPAASARTRTLDPDGDIEDPIGGDAQLYSQLATKLNSLIDKALSETILKQAHGS